MKDKSSKGSLARHCYDNSPIIEALVEVYFSNTKNDFSVWADFNNRVKNSYSNVEEHLIAKTELQISPAGEGKQRISPEKLYRFYNADKTRLIQASKDFVSINRLKPYSDYGTFRADIAEGLKNYTDLTAPKSVDRIGVRYVNEIVISEVNIELSDYFTYMPQIPVEITEAINNFLLQVQFAPGNGEHQVMLSLRSASPSAEGRVGFLLDIYDILQIHNEADTEFILNSIDEAHENIEQAFERIITDKSRELFGVVKNNDRKRSTEIQK